MRTGRVSSSEFRSAHLLRARPPAAQPTLEMGVSSSRVESCSSAMDLDGEGAEGILTRVGRWRGRWPVAGCGWRSDEPDSWWSRAHQLVGEHGLQRLPADSSGGSGDPAWELDLRKCKVASAYLKYGESA